MGEGNDNKKVNESEAGYRTKRTIKLSSFTEQEEENYRYWINLTPEQRIASVTALIEGMFEDELKTTRNDRLFFDAS